MTRAGLMSFVSLVAAAVLCGPALANTSTTTVGSKQNGKTVQIRSGTRLKIVLGGASASTGYSWNLIHTPSRNVLRVVTNGELENAGKCGAGEIGCRQNTVFVFRAARAATATTTKLKLVLLPPGRPAKPVKTYTLTVRILERIIVCSTGKKC